ncbi:MAG: cohesin domain-containing protein, partial [Chloroflexota bacterium]
MAIQQKRMRRWGLLLGVCAALILGLVAPVALGQAMTRVYVSPPERLLMVGRTSFVELRVDDVRDLFGVQLEVSYDPTVVRITDADPVAPGVQIGAGNIFDGLPWNVDYNIVDPAAGKIRYAFQLQRTVTAGVSGNGSLARLDFTGLVPGASPVTWVEVILTDLHGRSLEHTREPGRIRVLVMPFTETPTPVGYVSPTPSSTPRPAGSATPMGPATETPTPTNTRNPCCPATETPTPTATTRVLPEVYIEPALQYIRPNNMGAAEIRIRNVPELYAAWVRLTYRSDIIEVQDDDAGAPGIQIEPGTLFAGKHWFLVSNQASPGLNTIVYGAKLSFTEDPNVGGGLLARIKFRALQQGGCPLEFVDVILTDRSGNTYAVIQSNGLINVTSVLPTVTATPSPTPVGGVTPTPTPVTPVASRTPVLYVQPEASSLAVGAEADIDVMVRDVVNLRGAEFHIQYDPTLIQILDLIPSVAGTQLAYGGFLTPDSVLQNGVNAGTGMIDFAISQSPATPPRSGTGVIARMRVRALAEGATPLSIRSSRLLDPANQPIGHAAAGGFVAIRTRTVIGRIHVQGRLAHGGVQIKRGATLLGTTYADGTFLFPCPVEAGETFQVSASLPGYLTIARTVLVPDQPLVDLGVGTLSGGDVVGPQVTVTRAVGCPGAATVIIPGPQDQRINILDLTFVAGSFGLAAGDPG